MTCKQDPPRLASATGLLYFSFSRHRNSERQLFEVSQLCNLWLGQFCQNFHACFNPGQSSYQYLPLYEFFRTFPCLNSVNIFVDITRTDCLCSSTLYGGRGSLRTQTYFRTQARGGVRERNESATVRSFHPYPPPQIPLPAPRGAHSYAQRVRVNRLLVRSPFPGGLSGYGK